MSSVRGNGVLCSIAVAVVLRKSIVMQHVVWMEAGVSSSSFTAVNFQVVSTAKRLSTCCSSFLSFF